MHILSPETDNCPSWISGRERMTVENISWSISTKECCRPRRGLNPRPLGLQSDGASNWATEAGQSTVTIRQIKTWNDNTINWVGRYLSNIDDICPLAIPNKVTIPMHIPSLVKIHWYLLKISSRNETGRMYTTWIDNGWLRWNNNAQPLSCGRV